MGTTEMRLFTFDEVVGLLEMLTLFPTDDSEDFFLEVTAQYHAYREMMAQSGEREGAGSEDVNDSLAALAR